MPDRRDAGRKVAGILGCVALVAAVILGVRYGFPGATRGIPGLGASAGATIGPASTLAELGEAARGSDPSALSEIERRLPASPKSAGKAFTEEEAKGWLAVLNGLRTGFLGYKAPGRITTVRAACRILDGFTVEPAASPWADALAPIHDLLIASLGDADPNLRAAGLDQVARLWVWLPARSLTEAEETTLVKWKESLYQPVVRCLGHRDARTLVAAVACLGALPIDNAAAPALAYLEKDIPEVRKQILVSFARRNLLLTDDVLLSRLHDPDALIRAAAHDILQVRGLSREQITLGRLIFSPSPRERMSVIPMLKDRTDVDPAIWLIQLSRDPEEMVRLSAIEAMGGVLKSSAVKRRLTEMARSDASEAVRKAAGKFAPPVRENTASLPPLPGSPNLNPRAN